MNFIRQKKYIYLVISQQNLKLNCFFVFFIIKESHFFVLFSFFSKIFIVGIDRIDLINWCMFCTYFVKKSQQVIYSLYLFNNHEKPRFWQDERYGSQFLLQINRKKYKSVTLSFPSNEKQFFAS